ncbi:uncharacterized protein LOC129731180 isoform X2 [Wyeomyia smithii]|uniref:uncharacterized protein LOC129731180 isoform X2 n=1 Tax=Wyeomyia smithii TaxID=174621 RepID=UPI002467F121|nr:uncharacterized protein LOC129731180 isoform X2 [Wyeomyia smithii]
MPGLVVLCLQLILAGGGIVRGAPSSALIAPPEQRQQRLHTVGILSASSAGYGRPLHFNTSKRLQSPSPVIIEPGDIFAFRQHHQPPPLTDRLQQQQQQQQQQLDESYQQPAHFRQQQFASSPIHPNQPFHGQYGHKQQHKHPYFHGDSAESLEQQADKQPEEFSLASSELENEIDNNRFYGGSPPLAEPAPESGDALPPRPRHDTIESIDLIRERLEQIKQEEDIEIKSNLLMKMLEQLPQGPLPIVYVEDAGGSGASSAEDESTHGGMGDDTELSNESGVVTDQLQQFSGSSNKRSGRYYRRYPWKRQNARSRTYDADARYLCVPSRDDVFKLLVGLHENRIGNHQKTINFCNRKRPAKAIFTNIRFLG